MSFFGVVTTISVFGKTFSPSVYLSVITLPLFVILFLLNYSKVKKYFVILAFFLFAFVFLSTTSLANSFIYFEISDGLFGTNSFRTFGEEALKYGYDLFCIFYSIIMISLIDKKHIYMILTLLAVSLLFVFVFQILVSYSNNSFIVNVYDKFNFLGCLSSSDTLKRIVKNYGYFRFCGLSNEPASNSILFGCVIFPFLSYVLLKKFSYFTLKSKIVFFCITLCMLAFAILTVSSSVFVGLFVFYLFFYIYSCYFSIISKKTSILIMLVFISLVIISLSVPLTRNYIFQFVGKIFNFNDFSTQHRYSTIYNDLLVFIKNPLFGCGDGLQGYFYLENIAGTIFVQNPETKMAITGQFGLMSGGSTLPSVISGFGILGLTIIIICIKKILSLANTKNLFFSCNKIIIYGSLMTLLFLSLASQNIHFNPAYYIVLSLPFIFSNNHLINSFSNTDLYTREKGILYYYTSV